MGYKCCAEVAEIVLCNKKRKIKNEQRGKVLWDAALKSDIRNTAGA
jgi:hypothetical protein